MKNNQNYLDFVPKICERFKSKIDDLSFETLASLKNGAWFLNENRIVTILLENKGFINHFAQKFLKKPKITQIHLEEFGSFIWQKIDGKKSIFEIGKDLKSNFGDKAEPLYGRLVLYVKNLHSNGFIEFVK